MPLLLPLTDPAALAAALLAASVESCRARRAPAKATRRKGAKRLCRIIESSSGTYRAWKRIVIVCMMVEQWYLVLTLGNASASPCPRSVKEGRPFRMPPTRPSAFHMPHIPRPHMSANSQRKYAYQVRVHSLELRKPLPESAGGVSVLWTRGSKTAVTGEKSFTTTALATYEEDLSLICTLFVEDGKNVGFAEKLCTFAAVESRTVGKLAGCRTAGKCKLDISAYASMDGAAAAPAPLELRLTRNGQDVGMLKMSISCRWLQQSLGGSSAAPGPPPALGRPGGPRGLSSLGESLRFSDLSAFSEDDFSDASSEYSLDPTEVEKQRLAELEAFAEPETPPDTPHAVVDLRDPPSSGGTPSPPARAATASAAAAAAAPSMVRVPRGSAGGVVASRLAQYGSPASAPIPAPASGLTPAPNAPVPLYSVGTTASAPEATPTSDRGVVSPRQRAATVSPAATSDISPRCRATSTNSPSGSLVERAGSGSGSSSVGGAGGRSHTVAGCTGSVISAGLEASGRARIEAERRELEAQASASLSLHKRMTARLEAEREEWHTEKESLSQQLASGREALLEQQTDARKRELEARKLLTERDEARAEASRLKAEREELQARLQGGSGADSDDRLAVVGSEAELQGKLSQSEAHLTEVSRKMTKAHKKQENLLAQFEAEIELLSDKVDQLEDECCEAEQARLGAESVQGDAERRCREVELELERHTRRAAIQPVGTQELADQLEMANEVKQTLVSEMALFTDELATLKVEYAQVQEDKDEAHLRVRKGEEKSRRLRLHLTRLEVQIADWNNARADEDEEKTLAFKAAMQAQEERIRELERMVAEAVPPGGKAKRWPWESKMV